MPIFRSTSADEAPQRQLKCVLDEHSHSKNCLSVQGPLCGYLP